MELPQIEKWNLKTSAKRSKHYYKNYYLNNKEKYLIANQKYIASIRQQVIQKRIAPDCDLIKRLKKDRHKLSSKDRYRLKIVKKVLGGKGFFQKCYNVDKKSQQPYLSLKLNKDSYCFLNVPKTTTKNSSSKQERYEFSWMFKKERKILEKALKIKPLLFRKKLNNLERQLHLVKSRWKEHVDIIRTVNQIPQSLGWQRSDYYEKSKLGFLLFAYSEAGGKNKLVYDFDHWKKDQYGNYRYSKKVRKDLDKAVECLINYWKLPWYEISKSGSPKLHIETDILPNKGKLYRQLGNIDLEIGDVIGKGMQTTLPISQNRQIRFTKWTSNADQLPFLSARKLESGLNKVFLSTYKRTFKVKKKFPKSIEKWRNNWLLDGEKPGNKKLVKNAKILAIESLPKVGLYKVKYSLEKEQKYFLLNTYQNCHKKDYQWLLYEGNKDFIIQKGLRYWLFYKSYNGSSLSFQQNQ